MPTRTSRAARRLLACGILAALGAACLDSTPHAQDHGHGHSHDEDAEDLQITVWGQIHELFVEHPPLVAGRPARFAVHVTDHLTGRPRREGELRFELLGAEGARLEHVEPAPARAGIYLPELTFPRAGTWTLRVGVPTPEGEDVIDLDQLFVHRDAHHAAHAAAPDEPDGIAFLKEQQWRLGTRIEQVTSRAVREHLVVPALVRAAPERMARVSPPLAGALVAVPDGPPLAIGRRVEAGELLAYLRPPLSDLALKLVEAEAELERTRLGLAHAAALLERTRLLYEDQARSRRELEEAQFQHQSAEAAHRGAQAVAASLARSGLVLPDAPADGPALPLFELRAPIAGTVTRVSAAIGEHVSEERALLEILDAELIHVELRIRPEQLARLDSLAEPLLRRPRAGGDAPRVLDLPAPKLVFAGLEVDAATQTVPLLYAVQNDGEEPLRIGAHLEALLAIGDAGHGPAVPLTALVDDDGEPTVYVQLSGELFEQRHVRLGARDARWVRVLDGLGEGERVVTGGAYAVRLASASGSIPHHEH